MKHFTTSSFSLFSLLSATSITLILTSLHALALTFFQRLYFSIMPAIRKPLRDRCNVHLKVVTAIPTEESLDTPLHKPKGDVPLRSRKLRRPIPDVSVPYSNPVKQYAPEGPRLYPVNPRTVRGLQSLHKLVPYLYLAFHEGSQLPQSLVTNDGTAFTHIIKIAHATEQRMAGTVEVKIDPKRGLHSLVLVIPTTPPHRRGRRRVRSKGERNTTVLTDNQMLAARDFLSLALPYYLEAHPRDDIPTASADVARLLITAPASDGAASDVMSVAVCYLSFASEESVETVLGYVDNEEDIPYAWRDVVGEGEDGVGLLNRIAGLVE
jgi:hypothetical protein